MPSFNQARFIEAAVRSVLDQDYQPLELVIADGGSTDGTLQCLERLLGEFGSRLRWVSRKDSGPANAINKALRLARGEIIGWLNSDDLYAPGAIPTAARYFESNPEAVMVYGQGEHIDAQGKSLGRYPTLPPSASIHAFQEGCFICQPTVFLRRKVFNAVGYLDESLATAFDFELWLRIFRRFSDRIGFIDRVQAFSRLHEDCITQRSRRMVAVEGLRILAKHVGNPRPNWLLTYVEELCATYPFGCDVADIRAEVGELFEQVKDCFDDDALGRITGELAKDKRLQIALPGVYADIYPDGWAPPVLALRIRRLTEAASSIRLKCRHSAPVFWPILLKIKTNWGKESLTTIKKPGPFELEIDLSGSSVGDNLTVLVECKNTFVPKVVEPGSSDGRELAFIVEELHPGR
jgi:GT2 family glycosyltransferase